MTLAFPLLLAAVLAGAVPAGFGATLAIRQLAQSTQPPTLLPIAAYAVLGVWATFVIPTTPLLVISCVLAWTLFVLTAIDALAFRLPDILTLPLIAAGLAMAWWLPDHDVWDHAVGAFLGVAVFYAISVAYRQTRGQDGLGLGDAKLAGAAGAWLGWQALPYVVLLASAMGLLWVGLAVIRRGRTALRERIPFGVALCFAIWTIWLYGMPGFLSAP